MTRSLRRLRASPFAHGVTAHPDAVGVVNQPIGDAVSGSGITDLLVPAGDRELRCQDRGAGLIAILADLPGSQVMGQFELRYC
jgi:hypothetical protein